MTDTKKTRTPRNYDTILKGALSLTLPERVALVKELKESIKTEVDTLKAASNQAQEAAANI